MDRKVSVTTIAKQLLITSGMTRRKIISWFPVDHYGCECQPLITEIKKDLKKLRYLTCPKDKTGMKHYLITCKNCGSEIAKLWSPDSTLKEWCDLHYLCEHDEERWYGCMAVNISPIDGSLGFECTCGQDTRDFRVNSTLPMKDKIEKIKETEKGKIFGKANSKFKVKEIK